VSPAKLRPAVASFVVDLVVNYVARSPPPFLAIEFIRFRGFQHEFVLPGMARCAEGFAPAVSWPPFRRNDQAIAYDPHFDCSTEPALLNDWLRYANATGIANPNQLCSHIQNHLRNYIVITENLFGNSQRDGCFQTRFCFHRVWIHWTSANQSHQGLP
jgi:hypothetical protein